MSKITSVRISIIIAICVVIAGYTYYEARNIIEGPVISIEQPINGTTTNEQSIEITGQAKNINSITLNDRPITVDESGAFNEEITLSTGYNVAKVAGKDRFGRQEEIFVEIIQKDKAGELVLNDIEHT